MAGRKLNTAAGLVLIGAALGLSACVTTKEPPRQRSITIPYNPYEYDPDELFRAAQQHCEAYGMRAVYVDETIDPNSVRWRYRHYDCV
ncbi:MAG: hypothetical protein VX640_03225 [Pseudomonadota bacterium]|nr:hypothetical protein [Pseudomonadota bacterium]